MSVVRSSARSSHPGWTVRPPRAPSAATAKLLSTVIAGRTVTNLDPDAFWRRFGRVEHESLEFKASANNLREVIPAMAMTQAASIHQP